MSDDHKSLVASGYDRIASEYLDRFGRSSVRASKLAELVACLPAAASILDLGCGAGLPVAHELAATGFQVLGVDASGVQIEQARRNVPMATFIQADMASVRFAAETFDAVCAFYSITHLPSSEHAGLFQNIGAWLRPGGRFLASYGVEGGDWSGDWLGTAMHFSHLEPEATKRMLKEAGLGLETSEQLKQDNEDASFLWIMARKS